MSSQENKTKKDIIDNFKIHETDSGSTPVQIAILTARINHLIGHLKINPNDFHSRRGLLILVGQRKRLIKYYKSKNLEQFKQLAEKLSIKA
jgi:small subunit ribosomal protein S15